MNPTTTGRKGKLLLFAVTFAGLLLIGTSGYAAQQMTFNINATGAQEVPGPGDPDGSAIGTLTLNWQSSFFYEFGVTRQLGSGYYLSAGYFFSEASTPEKYYTPLVPDTDLHVGSLGVGRHGKHFNWALAGQIIGGAYRTVEGAVDPSVNGRYRLFTPSISFSVGYHF